MFKTFKKLVLVPIASLASIALLPAPANADGGDYLLPVAYSIGEFNAPASGTVSCADVRRDAWFNHEMARSDGETSPGADAVECRPEFYAAAEE